MTDPITKQKGLPGYWLLTHSGDQKEVDQLIELADRAPRVLAAVRSDINLPDEYERIPSPLGYYHQADQIVSGCGFNTMLEARPYRGKHQFIPFSRKFDDQFLRAGLSQETI